MTDISSEEVRRLVVQSQGFGKKFKKAIDVLDYLGVIQIDAITTVSRSHEIVPFSRVGPYNVSELYEDIYTKRKGFEYWGHSASWLPMKDFKYFKHRMCELAERGRKSSSLNKQMRLEYKELYKQIINQIKVDGEVSSGNYNNNNFTMLKWSNWKIEKQVLEDLFDQGILMCSNRKNNFKRYYDLSERIIPEEIKNTIISSKKAVKHLILKSIQLLGVSTKQEAVDYYRCNKWHAPWKEAIHELIEEKEVVEVKVSGWINNGLTTQKHLNRLEYPFSHSPTMLSPFDNLIWHRKRVDRIFDFKYILEFYKPSEKRQFGYYVMPLLINCSLVGRADLRLDRKNNLLQVLNICFEENKIEPVSDALVKLSIHLNANDVKIIKCSSEVKKNILEDLCNKKIKEHSC